MKPADSPRPWVAVASGVLAVVATILYPVAVFYGLQVYGPRTAALIVLVALVPMLVVRLARADRSELRKVAFLPLLIVGLVGTSAALGQVGLMLLVPVVINAALAVTFGVTLRNPPPMIERFARLQDPDLTDAEVAWCRMWTAIWTGFFVLNVVVVTALAVNGWIRAWTYYTGLIAYVLMGGLFTAEYVLRKARFGRFSTHLLDRILAWGLARLGWEPFRRREQ